MSSETAPPGRYAMVLRGQTVGGSSQSSFSSTLSSSVVLSVEKNGSATACRGRRWHSVVTSNDGQGKPDVMEYVEQQGLRGAAGVPVRNWRSASQPVAFDAWNRSDAK